MTSLTAWAEDPVVCSQAVSRAKRALARPHAVEHLERYYDPSSGYAGTVFNDLQPNDPTTIGVADLLAVTTLSVRIGPRTVRRFLDPARAREATALLGDIPQDAHIEDDDVATISNEMAAFYRFTKATIGSNPWVTASKLCARKRPHLFPVRDRVVLDLLGLPADYSANWPAFAWIMRDEELREHLRGVVREAQGRGAQVGDAALLLRHLDVILWMTGTHG